MASSSPSRFIVGGSSFGTQNAHSEAAIAAYVRGRFDEQKEVAAQPPTEDVRKAYDGLSTAAFKFVTRGSTQALTDIDVAAFEAAVEKSVEHRSRIAKGMD